MGACYKSIVGAQSGMYEGFGGWRWSLGHSANVSVDKGMSAALMVQAVSRKQWGVGGIDAGMQVETITRT